MIKFFSIRESVEKHIIIIGDVSPRSKRDGAEMGFFLLQRAFCGTFPSGFCVVVDFHGSDTNGVRDGTQSRDA